MQNVGCKHSGTPYIYRIEINLKEDKPIVNQSLLLKKYQGGKSSWIYAKIPVIRQDNHSPFRWVRVRGTIDDFEIKNYHLMPMKDGNLFLPVRAEIRKKIGKKEGDYIQVVLYPDNLPAEIPEELRLCLLDEPIAYETFLSYTDGEQKAFIDWISSVKKIETKTERIAKAINMLQKKQKLAAPFNKRKE